MKLVISTIIYTIICCYEFGESMGGSVGDSCPVARTGAAGTCRIITECKPVIDEIVKLGLFPTGCGFRGSEQIICCPNPAAPPKPTRTPSTRISALSKFHWLYCYYS